MLYQIATKITDKESGEVYIITSSSPHLVRYTNGQTKGECLPEELESKFILAEEEQAFGRSNPTRSELSVNDFLSDNELIGFLKGTSLHLLLRGKGETAVNDVKDSIKLLSELVKVLEKAK